MHTSPWRRVHAITRYIRSPKIWKLALLLVIVIITWLATTDAPPEFTTHIWDKSNHLMAFTTLTLITRLAEQKPNRSRRFLLLIGYGVLVEILQSYLPYRSASLLDLVADILGITLGE
ncbi:MAG: VanZ family protein, partial [Gammaproteobacteria bacterium]